jgi:hypothetical protein
MQNKNILLKQLLEDIKNMNLGAQITAEDDTLSDADKVIIIAEDIIDTMKQYLIEY